MLWKISRLLIQLLQALGLLNQQKATMLIQWKVHKMNTAYISNVVTFPLTKGSLEATCNPMCIPIISQHLKISICRELENIMCYEIH